LKSKVNQVEDEYVLVLLLWLWRSEASANVR
jgi:hypothetical protein